MEKSFYTKEFILKTFYTKEGKQNSGHMVPAWLKKNGYYEDLMNYYSDSKSLSETLYRILNDIDVRPVCKVCGNEVAYCQGERDRGFRKYCSNKVCRNKDAEMRETMSKKSKEYFENMTDEDKESYFKHRAEVSKKQKKEPEDVKVIEKMKRQSPQKNDGDCAKRFKNTIMYATMQEQGFATYREKVEADLKAYYDAVPFVEEPKLTKELIQEKLMSKDGTSGCCDGHSKIIRPLTHRGCNVDVNTGKLIINDDCKDVFEELMDKFDSNRVK